MDAMAARRCKTRTVPPPPAPASLGMLVCILGMILGALPARAQTGFININCGSSAGSFESYTGLTFEADNYISTGFPVDNAAYTGRLIELSSFRTFPKASTPTKNCYEVPVLANNQYNVKAIFYYGNYGPTQTPTIDFQLALESTVWADLSINSTETSYYVEREAVYFTRNTTLSVCLIRTLDTSDPFISGLQLRLLPPQIYLYRFPLPANLWLYEVARYNFGHSDNDTRYPDDLFDRIWSAQPASITYTQLPGIENKKYVDDASSDDLPPDRVMQTAMTDDTQISLTYTIPESTGSQFSIFYVSFLIAEVTVLAPGTRRVMDVTGNFVNSTLTVDTSTGTPFTVYNVLSIYQPPPDGVLRFVVTLNNQSTPGLGPILNAFELYGIGLVNNGTRVAEVDALAVVKDALGIVQWSGDPCFPVPWQFLHCTADQVTSIDLSGQGLTGGIPDFSPLTALTYLDLSSNAFTGPLPDWVGVLSSLRTLNVADNQLNGTFPSTYLTTIPGFNYSNNLQLTCNQVGNTICQVSQPPPSPPSSTPRSASAPPSPLSATSMSKTSSSAGPIIGAVVGVILLLAVIIIGFLLYCCWYKPKQSRMKLHPPPSPMMDVAFSVPSRAETPLHVPGTRGKAQPFTLLAVREATNKFARKIGEGGFGPVYFGLLPNQQEVAVKVMSGKTQQGFSEFSNEIDLLSTVHYKKLVSLVGYCQEGQDLMLLYEYMSGGDLRQRLYGPKASYFPLNWRQRLQIAQDAAKGLDYLHHGCSPAILHRDVKSSNILLTEKLEAKVADFGLSKLIDGEQTHVMTMVKGTLGYLDPDYNTTGMLTDKSDVYSFGVLLLELLLGQPPISKEGPSSKFIVDKVRASMNTGSLQALVDPGLRGDFRMESAWKLAEVAMSCVALSAASRPNMNRVVAELGQVLEIEFGGQGNTNTGWDSSGSDPLTTNSYSNASTHPPEAPSQIFHQDVRPQAY